MIFLQKIKKFRLPVFLLLIQICSIGFLRGQPLKAFSYSNIYKLDNSSRFTLLNSRLGSRFSLSYISSENGIRTGSMGFDMDENSALYIGVSVNGKNYCFRTSPLPPDNRYFDRQEMSFSPACMNLKGRTPEGIEINFELISPFTASSSLEDEDHLKTQIFPGFYFKIAVKNNSEKIKKLRLRTGFRQIPVNSFNYMAMRQFGYKKGAQKMYYRDNNSREGKIMLAALKDTADGNYSEGGTSGLEYFFDLDRDKSRQFTLGYFCYSDRPVIRDRRTNQDLKFYYTRFWKDVDEVYNYALENLDKNLERGRAFDQIVSSTTASSEEKWLFALTFHNDLANSFLLADEKGQARFYLAEGRFTHLSTVDVAHETELNALFCPWRLKLQLQQWTDYIARFKVMVPPDRELAKSKVYYQGLTSSDYGPYLYHDVGDLPFVSETSNYDYGPHMAVEENTSFVLLLHWYWKISGDDEFVRSMLGIADVLLQSLINRDTDNNGIADAAFGWTTYDANEALRRSPENTYLAVKELAAYELAADMMLVLANMKGERKDSVIHEGIIDGQGIGYKASVSIENYQLRNNQAEKYKKESEKILRSLQQAYSKYSYIPLSLDESFPQWDQHSVVIGEGLFLPALSGFTSPVLKSLADLLKEDYRKAYELSKDEYGIRLTSGEGTTWFSKIMVSDIVARKWYGMSQSSAYYAYRWNRNNYYAYNDGAFDKTNNWTGYWYPRGVCSLAYILCDYPVPTDMLKTLRQLSR